MNRHLLIATLLGTIAIACDSDSIIPEPQQQLVIEGWIDDGGAPIVIPTLTLPVTTEPHSFNEIKDNILRWARVTITDGTDTVVLRGHYNEGYFPPYIYTDDEFCGHAGGTYTITVDYRQYHATATTTIPPIVRPDSICLSRVSGEGDDDAYEVVTHFVDPPDEKNYYALFSRCGAGDRHFRLSSFGTLDDSDFNRGDSIKVRIYRAPTFRERYHRYFFPEDTVGVKFAQIDAQSYDVLTDYTQVSVMASNAFIPAQINMRTNVEGGLGYWVGCGAVFDYFIVPGKRKTEENASARQVPRR